jgi:hypothetical protein
MSTRLSRLYPWPVVLLPIAVACGGGGKPPNGPANGEKEPQVVVGEGSADVFLDEPSGPSSGDDAGAGSKTREYYSDVTHEVGVKGDPTAPKTVNKLRVVVRFAVPKVQPPTARDPHTVNRVLWAIRTQIASCFYKGSGKTATEELSMVGWLTVNQKGEVTGGGVEKSDEPLKKGAVDECIMENAKGLAFIAAGDDVKVRFKLKLQTLDATNLTDFKPTASTPEK